MSSSFLLLTLRSTWAHTAEGQRLEPAPPKQIENIRCCETHGRPGQSGPRLQALDVYTRECEPSASLSPSATPPPSTHGSKSGELGVGMCQRHGALANCYKPVARRRVCVEVRSSQVESGEGNPGSALAKQTNAPGLAGRVETRSVEGLICCLLDGADGHGPEHSAGLSGYFALRWCRPFSW